jgi:hypothetical protein
MEFLKPLHLIKQINTQNVTNLSDYGNQEIKDLEFTP